MWKYGTCRMTKKIPFTKQTTVCFLYLNFTTIHTYTTSISKEKKSKQVQLHVNNLCSLTTS